MTRSRLVRDLGALALVLVGCHAALGQLTPTEKRSGIVAEKVKATTDFGCEPGSTYRGEVVMVGDDALTLRHQDSPKDEAVEITFRVVDVLRQGGVHNSAKGAFSYLWSDVKKGDVVTVHAIIDKAEQRSYCTEICIQRRRGGELPAAHKPKSDGRYLQDKIFNAIENGEDVSEGEVLKAFPHRSPPTSPGVVDAYFFPPAYRARLSENRERLAKDKDLKATPPEKK